MSNLIRTTITIPESTYKQAKLEASSRDISFSAFVSDTLENKLLISNAKGEKSPLGVFDLESRNIYKNRKDIYNGRLKRKMGI